MTALLKAQAAWGDNLPDWIVALAAECERTSQAQAARLLGYSRPVITWVLTNRYGVDGRRGDLAKVEARVRAEIMTDRVWCPAISPIAGEILITDCRDNQALPFSAHNPQRVSLYRACRSSCPHSQISGGINAE